MKKLFSLSLVAVFAIFLTSCEDAPVADFEYTIDGSTVTFKNKTEGNATSYNWQFGDGASSTEENPTHTYSGGGDYAVTLVSQNESGPSEPVVKTVTIEGEGNSTVQVPDFPDADAVLVAVNLSTFVEQGGFKIETKLGAAVSLFYDGNEDLVDVGEVKADDDILEKNESNYYSHFAVSGEYGNPVNWTVAGGNGFEPITKSVTLGFPTMSEITSGDVTLGSDYTLTLEQDITGADEVLIVIAGGENTYTKSYPLDGNTYVVPASDIENIGATENGIVSASAYKYESEDVGGKIVYFLNQGNATKTVEIK